MGLYQDARNWLTRQLEPGDPQTFVAGGGNQGQQSHFTSTVRDRDNLERFEDIYKQGGPVAQLVDTRALMTFGTGADFESDEDITDSEGRTIGEWLNENFNDRDNLLIKLGREAYIYGDSFGEIVETRGGGFSHVATVNPKTMEADYNNNGNILGWTQTIHVRTGQKLTQTFTADDIGHFTLSKLGREPFGVSLIARNLDEVQRYARNQEALENYLRLHGFPKYHIRVGREDGPAVDDKTLKRVRRRFQDFDEKTNFTTGVDINIEPLDTADAEIEGVTEHDLMNLAAGFGVPEEMAGLGRGSTEATAKVRLQAFERSARADQRNLADQFIQQIVRPVLDEYSPFPRDVDIDLRFGDVVSDQQSTAEWLRDFKDDFTLDERREMLGFSSFEGDPEDLGNQAPSENQEEGGGGFFNMADGGSGNPNRRLARSGDEEDDLLLECFESVLWSEESDRSLFTFADEDVPEFAIERIRDAVNDGALFSQIDSISSGQRMDLREAMLDSLEERHGWSLDSLRDNLREAIDGLSKQEAEVVARTETGSIINSARQKAYSERGMEDEAVFKWTGPSNNRTTETCEWLKEQTDPDLGGEPVTIEELKQLIGEAPRHDDDMQDDMGRPDDFIPHIQCRHTFVRNVE